MVVRCTDPVICAIDEDLQLLGVYDVLARTLEQRGIRVDMRTYVSHAAFLDDPPDRADACILSARVDGKSATELAALLPDMGKIFVYTNGPPELVARGPGIAGVFSKGVDGRLLADALHAALGELRRTDRAA